MKEQDKNKLYINQLFNVQDIEINHLVVVKDIKPEYFICRFSYSIDNKYNDIVNFDVTIRPEDIESVRKRELATSLIILKQEKVLEIKSEILKLQIDILEDTIKMETATLKNLKERQMEVNDALQKIWGHKENDK